MNETHILDIFEELDADEFDLKGSGFSSAECAYLLSMCILYPQGCTSPCVLYYQGCS
ncbi:hypothetical protein D3C76_181920 [compost metagenome]